MAITPNVPTEQANKQAVRSNTRGGPNPWSVAIDPAVMVNAFATTSGVLRLTVTDNTSTFTISGTGTGLVTQTLSGASSNVTALISGLANGPLSTTNFFVNASPSMYLANTTVDIVVPTGIVLQVVSGTGVTPTITNIVLSGTNAEAVTYPSYVGPGYAVPTWVDDATVHAYPVNGIGAVVQDTTKTVQTQVRQISTNVSETQQYNGYFAVYSGNLYQTGQKRTYRQQS